MSKDLRAVRGVLFDMDGTLYDTESTSIFAWAVAGREYGLSIPRRFMVECIGLPTRDIEKKFYSELSRDIDYREFRARKLKVMSDIIESAGVDFKPGVHEVLACIKKLGLLSAVVTSTTTSRALYNLEAGGILKSFDTVVSGDMVKKGKPAPDCYILAAKKLGLKTSECLVAEDSRNGILAASAAGCVSVLIPDILEPDSDMLAAADYVKKDLTELAELLEGAQR